MNEFFRKTFRIYPRLRQLFYKHYNRLFFLLLGIKYGKNLQVFNKIYVGGKGKIIIGDNLVFTKWGRLNPLCRNIRGMFFTAFATGGIVDQIEHRKNGFLVQQRDVKGMIEGIQWILYEANYMVLSRAAREYVINHYSYNEILHLHHSVLS